MMFTWHTPRLRGLRSAGRWTPRSLIPTALGAAVLTLAACTSGESIAAPTDPAVAFHQMGRTSAIEQFALAQGTYCDDLTSLVCVGLSNDLGIGYILNNSAANGPLPFGKSAVYYILDLGGVNARWWAKNGISPRYPRFSIRGSVNESRLNDGRRRLRISLDAKNTFAAFGREYYDAAGQFASYDVAVGADFFEYPGVDPAAPDKLPRAGDVTAELDLIIPADFVGMPDLAQVVYEPTAGMEIRRMDVTVAFSGRLRSAFNDMPADTRVYVRVRDDWSHKVVPARQYTPPSIEVTRVRDREFAIGKDDQ